MMATKLSSALVAPSKVANILDWRRSVGAVLGLDVTRDRIGLALAEHPQNIREAVPLPPLSLQSGTKSKLNGDVVSELEAAVRRHRVCAFVVHWPVTEGRAGERCGRVLRVLDSVVGTSGGVVTMRRPFTLWTAGGGIGGQAQQGQGQGSRIDEWGRSADFARAPIYERGMSYSSKTAAGREQEPSADASEVAASVLDEWARDHWDIEEGAESCSEMERSAYKAKPTEEGLSRDFFFSMRSVDESNAEGAYLQAALL